MVDSPSLDGSPLIGDRPVWVRDNGDVRSVAGVIGDRFSLGDSVFSEIVGMNGGPPA